MTEACTATWACAFDQETRREAPQSVVHARTVYTWGNISANLLKQAHAQNWLRAARREDDELLNGMKSAVGNLTQTPIQTCMQGMPVSHLERHLQVST
jgi:hypothetical protein